MSKVGLPCDAVVRAIAFALEQPDDVGSGDIMLGTRHQGLPTAQGLSAWEHSSQMPHRSEYGFGHVDRAFRERRGICTSKTRSGVGSPTGLTEMAAVGSPTGSLCASPIRTLSVLGVTTGAGRLRWRTCGKRSSPAPHSSSGTRDRRFGSGCTWDASPGQSAGCMRAKYAIGAKSKEPGAVPSPSSALTTSFDEFAKPQPTRNTAIIPSSLR